MNWALCRALYLKHDTEVDEMSLVQAQGVNDLVEPEPGEEWWIMVEVGAIDKT